MPSVFINVATGEVTTGPNPVVVTEPGTITYKSDIWRRCSPDEAQMLDAALFDAPAYLRRLFDAVTEIHHDAAEFSTLRDAIAASLGGNYARADELLAPS